ncbi:hypothetical protein GCM10022280_08030 [Sphingomonas swuensis]|uniref:Uncharacterized protein n=1 Tax=Sphingomonas swuensis TaxID=977800 RepID=A0ABP7SJB2_9SPHN
MLYGVLAGFSVIPAAAEARGTTAFEILGRQPALAIATSGGKQVAKAKRPAPEPFLTPSTTTPTVLCDLRPHLTEGREPSARGTARISLPYRARAPPAV